MLIHSSLSLSLLSRHTSAPIRVSRETMALTSMHIVPHRTQPMTLPTTTAKPATPSTHFSRSSHITITPASSKSHPIRLRHVLTRTSASPSVDFTINIGDVLGDVQIYSAASGQAFFFNDLLDSSQGITVVALLRHFGCVCCWELASTLKESKARFDSAGVKLIAVGIGTTDKARILAERLPFPLDCLYADPDRKAYDVMGLYYGLGRTFFNPASAKVFSRWETLKEATKNYTIEATPDDKSSVLQQGGMFVFKGKELLYAWKDEGTGDHAPLDDIFDICLKSSSAVKP